MILFDMDKLRGRFVLMSVSRSEFNPDCVSLDTNDINLI